MMRIRTKRLDRLRGAITGAPVLPHVLDEAYEWFWMFGELYEEDHIAEAVMRKALRGGEDEPTGRSGLRISVVSAVDDDMVVTVA